MSGDIPARVKARVKATTIQGHSDSKRGGGARTANVADMSVTELVSQLDRSGLNVNGFETFEA